MAFGTPWAVGGGASHDVEIARQQTYDATGGAEGVSRPGNLKVQPLSVPGTKVRVAPGGALIVNRYPGGDGQTYTVRNDVQVEVDVAATGSGGGRSDLVVARVWDPQYEGPPPVDPNDFEYAGVDIIQGVSPTTKSARDLGLAYPAIALARIDLPASTGTVTAAHITDLREVAQPKSKRVVRSINLSEKGTGRTNISATSAYPAGGQTWPIEAENAGILDIEIPEWATHMVYALTWSQLSVIAGNGNAYGGMWLQVGATVDPDNWKGQAGSWDVAEGAGSHTTIMRVADTAAIPAALRGKTKRFYPRATRNSGVTAATPAAYWATSFEVDVTFEERRV